MQKVFKFIFFKVLIILVLGSLFYFVMDFSTTIVVVPNNKTLRPLEILPNTYQDAHCGMILIDTNFAAQVILPDGRTWFFHDQGGVPLWLEKRSFKNSAKVWMHSKDSRKWIDGYRAWFSLRDETPMLYGFAAYEKKQAGFISYNEMRLKMLRGENLLNPFVKKQLLGK